MWSGRQFSTSGLSSQCPGVGTEGMKCNSEGSQPHRFKNHYILSVLSRGHKCILFVLMTNSLELREVCRRYQALQGAVPC